MNPESDRLTQVWSSIRPAPVDLRARVLARLAETPDSVVVDPAPAQRLFARVGPDRRRDLTAGVLERLRRERTSSPTLPRVRPWAWAAAAHALAALLLFSLSNRTMQPEPAQVEGPLTVWRAPRGLDDPRPERWSTAGPGLFAWREDAAMRQLARRRYACERSAGQVQAGIAWLSTQLGPDGRFGPARPNPDLDAATQALAVLALAGEGRDDDQRRALLIRARGHLATLLPESPMARALVALAVVEADVPVAQARHHLSRVQPSLDPSGVSWLAVETAAARGIPISDALLAQARQTVAAPGKALALLAQGRRDEAGVALAALADDPPQRRVDGSVDPLAWWLPTLAMREGGEEAWVRWAVALQTACAGVQAEDGRIPSEQVRHSRTAGGDVLATAAVMLCLQAPYRTLPLRQGR